MNSDAIHTKLDLLHNTLFIALMIVGFLLLVIVAMVGVLAYHIRRKMTYLKDEDVYGALAKISHK